MVKFKSSFFKKRLIVCNQKETNRITDKPTGKEKQRRKLSVSIILSYPEKNSLPKINSPFTKMQHSGTWKDGFKTRKKILKI